MRDLLLVVTGGRYFDNRDQEQKLFFLLDKWQKFIRLVVQGGANGADMLTRKWCIERRVPVLTVYADWEKFGKSAGPKRNRRMMSLVHEIAKGTKLEPILLVCPGGSGTRDCASAALDMGVENRQLMMELKRFENG